jgi:ribbon-helix-helix CopG family protein
MIFCMTKTRSPLSVRLDPALAEALDRHCEQTGLSRSHVVQQGVAQYLVEQTGPTLGGLAEAVLPAAPTRAARGPRTSRQRRFRDYVREKRRR